MKIKEDKIESINNSLFSFLFSSTGNDIGNTGVKPLSEALKSNTTLTKLYLDREYKRKTYKWDSFTNCFSVLGM